MRYEIRERAFISIKHTLSVWYLSSHSSLKHLLDRHQSVLFPFEIKYVWDYVCKVESDVWMCIVKQRAPRAMTVKSNQTAQMAGWMQSVGFSSGSVVDERMWNTDKLSMRKQTDVLAIIRGIRHQNLWLWPRLTHSDVRLCTPLCPYIYIRVCVRPWWININTCLHAGMFIVIVMCACAWCRPDCDLSPAVNWRVC